ncbi:glycosyltransferase [Nocardioides salsibiostraticola]
MGTREPSGSPILHVSQAVEAGVAHVIADLVRAQTQAGLDVVVTCPPGELQELSRCAGAEVLDWPAARGPGPGTLGELRVLATLIQREHPAVVHLHSSQAGMVGRLVIRGRVPTVFSPHAWSWQPVVGPARTAAVAWERLAARWSHATVCVSEGERRGGLQHHIPGPLLVIQNGVEPDLAAQIDHATQTATRRALGLRPTAEIVVCCARLAQQKGQDFLLKAWPRVRDERPDCELVFIGDGPLREELELAAEGLSGVTFMGWQSRVECFRWMRAATVVVCPSRYEAMSLVPLEAAALGTPVIATRVEGMTAGLSPAARRIVEPGVPDALADALLEIVGDRDALARGSRQALAWARTQAAQNSPGQAYLDLYRELLSAHSG